MTTTILQGDCREILKTLLAASVHCCITSPPYFGLRDYGMSEQIGLEQTPDAYVQEMVTVFREVKRVLRDDGTLWLNLGDSYAGSGKGGNQANSPHQKQATNAGSLSVIGRTSREAASTKFAGQDRTFGYKAKDLIGIPWRVAFALQADGWYLRQDIIWHKPNPMPESITDRCTKSHEYLFMFSKLPKYYYDHEAIKEPSVYAPGKTNEVERAKGYYDGKWSGKDKQVGHGRQHAGFNEKWKTSRNDGSFKAIRETRNKRSVWTIAPMPFKEAHFATFPPGLVEPCVLAGSPPWGTILDPFSGAGTTGLVAHTHGRNSILIELNPEYVGIANRRLFAPKTPWAVDFPWA